MDQNLWNRQATWIESVKSFAGPQALKLGGRRSHRWQAGESYDRTAAGAHAGKQGFGHINGRRRKVAGLETREYPHGVLGPTYVSCVGKRSKSATRSNVVRKVRGKCRLDFEV